MRYRRNKKSRAKKIEADAGIERGLWVKDAESENQRVPGRADAFARARACKQLRADVRGRIVFISLSFSK